MAMTWGITVIMAAMCSSAWGQATPEKRYPITPRLVARALSNNGNETADEQVSLPVQVGATEPYPALEIVANDPQANTANGGARSTIKLACHSAGVCLPFYAVVTGQQIAITPAAMGTVTNSAVSFAAKAKGPITMRAGTHAVLFMDDQLAHIQVAVVTMENGENGKWIRVASPDHKQFYRAEVINGNELRGEF